MPSVVCVTEGVGKVSHTGKSSQLKVGQNVYDILKSDHSSEAVEIMNM